jgi:hypothetical protein
MIDLRKLVELASAMNEEGVEYIVFGGAAVNLHGIMRGTEDYDIFLRPTPENVESLKRALKRMWDDPSIDEITDNDFCGEFRSIRYGPPEDDVFIDFVAALGEAFAYDDLEAEIHTVENVPIRIATPRTLVRMKRDTVRPKDRLDADLLRRKFKITEM